MKFSAMFNPESPSKAGILPEDKRKGKIFSYFVGAIWGVTIFDLLYNLYVLWGVGDHDAQEYAGYISIEIILVMMLGLIWGGHRWYPHLARHLFLLLVVMGATFTFNATDIEIIFVGMTVPIIMAAFLIKPIYSYVYWGAITGAYILNLYLLNALSPEKVFFAGLISLLVIAGVSWLIAQSLDKALAEARALNEELDQRVKDRTQKLAEALQRERATAVRNETILEAIADGVVVFDAHQQVMVTNPAANQLAHRSLQALNLSEILTNVEDKAREIIHSWMGGQKPTDQNNVKFEWQGRTISATIAPVILPAVDGKQVDAGNVMVLRDFTKEAELERAKSFFLGMVSHELRTPMTAIKGYVKVLLDSEKENLSAPGYEHLQTIDVSIKQLLTLANELIDLSRLEAGEIELYPEWVDLTAIVKQAVKMVQQEFTNRNLSLEVRLPDHLPRLYLDKNRMLQVLLNLLSNAYKYTAQGGATIDVTYSGDWVNIAVADTGVGIKPADQAHLFSRFFRANDQLVQKAGGTGLGLSITKGLTELHGGQLTFTSQYGHGTTFQVTLPANTLPAVEAEPLETQTALPA
ncbi:MAG: hypothetical protein DPW09_05445 [Anaerolineae bacterium]|nr:hypothetical protein [Anaerolineales bacterium]MCQ3972879.1 hypothetical protein [Anaerolineae bacterium]